MQTSNANSNEGRINDGNRKFYDFQKPFGLNEFADEESAKNFNEKPNCEKIFKLIRENEIGTNQIFSGPFGLRKSKLYKKNIKMICI